MKKFSIVKRAYLWLSIWAVLLAGAIVLFGMNIRLSEEFTGGVNVTIKGTTDQEKLKQDLQSYLDKNNYKDSDVLFQEEGETTKISIKTTVENDDLVNVLSNQIKETLVQGKYISSANDIIAQSITGPSVGDYMKKSAKNALIVGLGLMAVYMMFAFAGIRKVISPSTLAAVTIVTMVFDVGVPAGAYGLLMMFNHSLSIDTVFIIAVLTNMGYSINDTIIIFDRVRENVQNASEKTAIYGKIFDASIRQTMRRSMGTVGSTLLVIIAMYIFGSGSIQNFAFTIGIGVIAGSYSSIFISAPLAYLLMGKRKKERKQMNTVE